MCEDTKDRAAIRIAGRSQRIYCRRTWYQVRRLLPGMPPSLPRSVTTLRPTISRAGTTALWKRFWRRWTRIRCCPESRSAAESRRGQPEGFLALAEGIKARGLHIVMYSGYTYEELLLMAEKNGALEALLRLVDVLVDGRYEAAQRDLTLSFRGSRNQRPIDLRRSRQAGKIVLAEKFC